MSETGRAGCGHLWRWKRTGSALRDGEGSGSITKEKVLSSALALGVSRWSRTGRAGSGRPRQRRRLTLGDCGRGRFEEAVSALEWRSRFIHIFYRL